MEPRFPLGSQRLWDGTPQERFVQPPPGQPGSRRHAVLAGAAWLPPGGSDAGALPGEGTPRSHTSSSGSEATTLCTAAAVLMSCVQRTQRLQQKSLQLFSSVGFQSRPCPQAPDVGQNEPSCLPVRRACSHASATQNSPQPHELSWASLGQDLQILGGPRGRLRDGGWGPWPRSQETQTHRVPLTDPHCLFQRGCPGRLEVSGTPKSLSFHSRKCAEFPRHWRLSRALR